MKNEKLKGKKGKRGKALLLFSFFIFLLLVFLSCEQPAGGQKDGGKQPKMGYVTLSLAGVMDEAEGRTILPSTPNTAEFKEFRLWFTNYATKVATIVYRPMEDLEEPVQLEVGEYELAVTAYKDTERKQPAAHAELTGTNRINISKSTGAKCIITLKAISSNMVIPGPEGNDEPAQGIFRWIIPCSFDKSVVTGSMRVETRDNPPQVMYNQPLATGNAGFTGSRTIEGDCILPVGYYNVIITLNTAMVVDGLGNQQKTVEIRDILHVYRYLDSVLYDLLFTDENFNRNYYTVTYHYNDREHEPVEKTVLWGTSPSSLGIWQRDGYSNAGWYTDPEFTTYYNNSPVYGSMNLYVRWMGNLSSAVFNFLGAPIYNGEAQTPSCIVSHDGITLQRDVDYTISASNNRNAGTDASYTITAIGGNYTGSKTGTFTIGRKPVSVIVTKEYNGNTTTAGATATIEGLISGDAVTVNVGAAGVYSDKNVGNKTVTITGFSLGGAAAGNYTLMTTGTGIITSKPVTITLGYGAVHSKTYDGNTTATLTNLGTTLTGVISGDTVTVVTGTGTFADKNVGWNKPVTFSGFSISGADAGNYILAEQPAERIADITQRYLAVRGLITISSKVYDGNTSVTFTAGTPFIGQDYGGVLTGDDVSLNGPTTFPLDAVRFVDKNVGQNKETITYPASWTLSGNDAGNYILIGLTATSSPAVNITPKPVTVTVAGKVYDGDTISLSANALSGIISPDEVRLMSNNLPADAGTHTINLSLAGDDAYNYNLTTSTQTVTITKRPITLINQYNLTKDYDGLTTIGIANPGVGTSGVLAQDTYATNPSVPRNTFVSVRRVGAAYGNFTDANAGANKTINITGDFYFEMTIETPDPNNSNNRSFNYYISEPPVRTTTGTINRVSIRVAGSSFPSIAVFPGQTPPDMSSMIKPGTGYHTWASTANLSPGRNSVNLTFTPNDTQNYLTETQAVSIYVIPRVEMVSVPGGSFQMGGTDSTNTPVHKVNLSAFRMSKYEITVAQYRAAIGQDLQLSAYATSQAQQDARLEQLNQWATGGFYNTVNFFEAVEFCNKLSAAEGLTSVYTISGTTVTANWSANGYRLPTEAEWEYAARGGNGSPGNYTYAGSNTAANVGVTTTSNSNQQIGTKAANGLGIYDMTGNGTEWCWDWRGNYSADEQTNPRGPDSGTYRVVRSDSTVLSPTWTRTGFDPSTTKTTAIRVVRNGS